MNFFVLNKENIEEMLFIEEKAHVSPWSKDIFEHCFKLKYHAWGIKEKNKLIGFIIYSTLMNECHILNICILPDEQGKGYGKKLLLYSLNHAKSVGVEMAFLEVRRSNATAIHLYHSVGFVMSGERKDYYPKLHGREDALIFAKDLLVE